jgi:hypothetical protein
MYLSFHLCTSISFNLKVVGCRLAGKVIVRKIPPVTKLKIIGVLV